MSNEPFLRRLMVVNVTSVLKDGLDVIINSSVSDVLIDAMAVRFDCHYQITTSQSFNQVFAFVGCVQENQSILSVNVHTILSVNLVGHSNLVAVTIDNASNSKAVLLESTLVIPRGLDGGATPGTSWTQPIFLGEYLLLPQFNRQWILILNAILMAQC